MSYEVDLPAGWAPYALAGSPASALWVTLVAPGALAVLRPGADPVLHEPASGPCRPMQAALGPGGALWYTRDDDRLGRLDPDGTECLLELPEGAAAYGVCRVGDEVWFTAPGIDRIGWVRDGSAPGWLDLPGYAAMLTATTDGAVWVALNAAGSLARIRDGQVAPVRLPPGSAPVGIAADGGTGVWFADIAGGRIGHVDADGAVSSIALPDPACRPHAVAADPDGGCWVTLWGSGELARVTPDGAVTTTALPGKEPHGLLVTDAEVWVAMESGSLVVRDR
jgi:virginiamycin B lyase